jgi:amphiphysin
MYLVNTVSRSASRARPSPSVNPESLKTPASPNISTSTSGYNEKKEFANRLNGHHAEGGGMANAPAAAPNRNAMAADDTGAFVPLPPRVTHSPASEQYVIAVYPFAGEAAGDLSFNAGDRIQVVKRTNNVNDWWTGSVNGKTGIFPGKLHIMLD